MTDIGGRRRRARGRRWLLGLLAPLVAFCGIWPLAASPARGAQTDVRSVLATRVDDPITPIIADHLDEAVGRAVDGGYEALVVEMDTPGGLDSAMRDIVQDFLGAEVPVVVHVTPRGARAASAGALIAWSSHVVAMAPGTTIGAATPVQLEGGEVADKIVEDAAAYARAIATERGRNVDVAAEAVTEGRALSATEALDLNAADLVAADRDDLLTALDGTEVTLADGDVVALDTADAPVEDFDLSWQRSILQFLADPNLAFIFLSIGTLGIVFEIASPGIGAAGGLGAVLVILGLVSLSVLPVDAAGLAFLVLAAALFVAEVFAPGIGVAAVLGAVSLVLAGIFGFSDEVPGLTIDLAAVIPTAVVVGAAVVLAGRLALQARAAPAPTGAGRLVGRRIEVGRTGATPQARVDGTWWTLRSDDPVTVGDAVRVTDTDGVVLVVRRDETPAGCEGDADDIDRTDNKETTP